MAFHILVAMKQLLVCDVDSLQSTQTLLRVAVVSPLSTGGHCGVMCSCWSEVRSCKRMRLFVLKAAETETHCLNQTVETNHESYHQKTCVTMETPSHFTRRFNLCLHCRLFLSSYKTEPCGNLWGSGVSESGFEWQTLTAFTKERLNRVQAHLYH